MKIFTSFLSALSMGFTLFLTGCTANQTNDSNNNFMAIGIAVGQTTNISLIGQEQVAGAKIAEAYFNRLNNKPIKLIFQDAGGNEATAINAFQTLINKNRVIGIIGPTTSQQGFSVLPLAERAKVPAIAPSTIAKGIPELGNYIARVSAGPDKVIPNVIKAAIKINPQMQKMATFYAQDQEALVQEAEIFQQAAQAQGLKLVAVQKFQTTDTDFQTQIANTLKLKPDLIAISGLPADGGNLVRQLRELGYQGIIVGGNGFNSSNIFATCKAFCNGVLVAQAYSHEYQSKINTAFRQAYFQQYQKEPPQFSAQTFTAVQVFAEALKALEQKTNLNQLSLAELRTQLNQQLLSGEYDTPLGKISFTPAGDVIQKNFYVAELKVDKDGKQGKFAFLK